MKLLQTYQDFAGLEDDQLEQLKNCLLQEIAPAQAQLQLIKNIQFFRGLAGVTVLPETLLGQAN